MNDPIPSAVQDVVDLFVSELGSLKFGDLEASELVAVCEAIKSQAADVTRAESELENARAALAEKKDLLLQKAQRALAYARVYAESRPELASRLERIALPRSLRRSGRSESAPQEPETSVAHDATALPARRRGRRQADPDVSLGEEVGLFGSTATG